MGEIMLGSKPGYSCMAAGLLDKYKSKKVETQFFHFCGRGVEQSEDSYVPVM